MLFKQIAQRQLCHRDAKLFGDLLIDASRFSIPTRPDRRE